MEDTLRFLVQHRYSVLLAVVFTEQVGLPLPAAPFLLAAGALARAGTMDLPISLALVAVTALIVDLLWYEIGRRRGSRILRWLCRISLEPDSCVRRTEQVFARHGLRSLLFAKFVPGLSMAAPPMSGMLHFGLGRFLLFDALGAVIWGGLFIALGYALSDQLELVAESLERLGGLLGVIAAAGFGAILCWKYLKRRRMVRALHIARITPEELKQKIDSGESPVVFDLRHPIDLRANPVTIPTASHLPMEELDRRYAEIPRDREVILFCSCPNEASSASIAFQLRRKGIDNVRPLAGGLDAWRGREFPVVPASQLITDSRSG